MLFTGYNCRDLLNISLFRPVFSPTEYIQIKGLGTRLFTFKVGHTEYPKSHFCLLDFCAVAEYFEEQYDYSLPLKFPRENSDAQCLRIFPFSSPLIPHKAAWSILLLHASREHSFIVRPP
jgi:hypothetical protein